MIYKVTDRGRVVHHNVIGFSCLVPLCEVKGSHIPHGMSPASWKRQVDCMTCLVNAAVLPWCGHGVGVAIHVDTVRVHRQCYHCAGTR